MFDSIIGLCGPAKLTHKINPHTWQLEEWWSVFHISCLSSGGLLAISGIPRLIEALWNSAFIFTGPFLCVNAYL